MFEPTSTTPVVNGTAHLRADNWQRLGRLLRAERQRQALSRENLAAKAKVSARSIQSAESGRVPKSRRPFTLDAIERALGWPFGTVDHVLGGGDPPLDVATSAHPPRGAAAPFITAVHIRATTYTVTCLPDDPIDPGDFDITVEFAGAVTYDGPRSEDQQWAVRRRNRWCLSRSGTWDLETSQDRCDDGWLAMHRFDLDTALKVAAKQAPHVTVNGTTPAELLAWRAE